MNFYKLILYVIIFFNTYGYAKSDSYTIIDKNTTLNSKIIYNNSFKINKSNVVFDCNNSIIKNNNSLKIGLLIYSKKKIKNIIVKNCVFVNFNYHGIYIGDFKRVQLSKNQNEIYDKSVSDILLDNINIEKSHKSAIFVGHHVQRVTIKNSIIKNTGTVGIYLEHSSRYNKIIHNTFSHEVNTKNKREDIAIDSSAHNVIKNNLFKNNSKGGIFLYKNCGEHIDNKKQVIRWQHSNYNRIESNLFLNEKVGIWIASRQSKNLINSNCADISMDKEKRYYQDFADFNEINNNYFYDVKKPIINEGDSNYIANNKANNKHILLQPDTKRNKYLNLPQQLNIYKNNQFNSLKFLNINKYGKK